MNQDVSRRKTITNLIGAVAILPFGRLIKPTASPPQVAPLLLPIISGRFRERGTLRRGAEAYLRQYPAESDSMRLCAKLLDGCDGTTHAMVMDHLSRSAAREFAAGDIVLIGGWALARSEARLLALASLVA